MCSNITHLAVMSNLGAVGPKCHYHQDYAPGPSGSLARHEFLIYVQCMPYYVYVDAQ